MREIKFRCWNNSAKAMYPANHFAVTADGVWMQLINREECKWFPNQGNMIFMQYTGLKDKNGTDVYEGDCFGLRNGKIGFVEWSNDVLGFILVDPDRNNEHNLHWYAKNQKVVGNKYEN